MARTYRHSYDDIDFGSLHLDLCVVAVDGGGHGRWASLGRYIGFSLSCLSDSRSHSSYKVVRARDLCELMF